jgi:ferredoxin-NADP reductase
MVARPGFAPDLLLFSPLWFFASIMLTEPQTSPVTPRRQLLFGVFVGLLFIGLPYIVPGYSYGLETSLLLGNLLAFGLWPARRAVLHFVKKQPLAGGVWSFTFATDTPMPFRPGQFVELMLPHSRSDQRGIRRYFSVASAPNSDEVIFTTRIAAQPSSFKQALLDLRSGQTLTAVGPQGNFTLSGGQRPTVLIAGGIGITPFLSMARQAQQAGQPLDATLIYCNNGNNAPFKSELRRIDGLRLQMVDTSSDTLSEDRLHQLAPEIAVSDVYLSGPPAMVMTLRRLVRKLGSKHIHTDAFIGY